MSSRPRVGAGGQTPDKLAAALRGWRLTKGWNQDELADHSGVSKATISLIERNFKNWLPREGTLEKLAKTFDITVPRLFVHPNQDLADSFKQHVTQATEQDARQPRDDDGIDFYVYSDRDSAALMVMAKPHLDVARALPQYDPETLRYIVITDNTMGDTLLMGDYAVIALGAPVTAGVYLLGSEAGYVIRRITPLLEAGKVRVSGDNMRYPIEPETVELERISPVARVVYSVRSAPVL